MAGRTRTQKKLAQRIDLNYFKRLYPIPRWRRILSAVLVLLGLAWLLWGRERPYNAGPLSHSHAMLGKNCAACHVSSAVFGKKVTDQACLACHDGPVHQAQQMFTPACTECHVEHQGSFRLSATSDAACTQCHSDLKTKNGATQFAVKVTSFDGDHPAFKVPADPGTVKLNHEVHLKKDLRGPHGPVQLRCADCHQSNGASIAPIDFQKDCAGCHPLAFDKRFEDPVPHKKPDVVMDYARKRFTEYIAKHPEEVHMADPADPRIMRPPLPPARDAAEWISRRMSDTQQLMWRKTCKECHSVNFKPGADLPEIPEAAIPVRWMKHAWFDHDAHQAVACAECHAKAATSKETSDVLLPAIATCRRCHNSSADAAESRCSECHVYHDWTKEKRPEGRPINFISAISAAIRQ
jgi:hypothetical protein